MADQAQKLRELVKKRKITVLSDNNKEGEFSADKPA